MRVLGLRVLVRRDRIAEKKGSIYIPERARSRPQAGEVIAVGSAVDDVKPGDRVLFGRYAGVEIQIGDEHYVTLWDRDIIAVLEDLRSPDAPARA